MFFKIVIILYTSHYWEVSYLVFLQLIDNFLKLLSCQRITTMWFAFYGIVKIRLLGLHFILSAYWIWWIVCYLYALFTCKRYILNAISSSEWYAVWSLIDVREISSSCSQICEWMAKVTVTFWGSEGEEWCALKSRFLCVIWILVYLRTSLHHIYVLNT